MTWLLRFALGLSARPEDLAEIREQVPEILDPAWQPSGFRLLPFIVLIHPRWLVDNPAAFVEAVRKWASTADDQPKVAHQRIREDARSPCEHPECPRRSSTTRADAAPPEPPEPPIARLMVVGGGPGQKPLLTRFLDVVKRVHAGAGPARKVFVTDPFLLTDSSENGTSGGFENFCRYLEALELADRVILAIPPGPKRPTANRTRWIESISKRFPSITVQSFAAKLHFHDRFYVVEHEKGIVRGVFGPSMNGLSDTDIALIGELEVPGALSTLSSWFDLTTPASPTKRRKKSRSRR